MNKQKVHPEKCSQESKGPRNLSLSMTDETEMFIPDTRFPGASRRVDIKYKKGLTYVRKICIILYSFGEPVSGSINKSRFSFTTEEGTGEKMGKREGGKKKNLLTIQTF